MRSTLAFIALCFISCSSGFAAAKNSAPRSTSPRPFDLNTGWQMREASLISEDAARISSSDFKAGDWYKATVPGTVLTTLVNDGVYPEPMYGENMRPIPESLSTGSYWFRTSFVVPASYAGTHVWLNFDGINFSSEIWVNGQKVGATRGAFKRGIFDISTFVKADTRAVLAVKVSPQPHPGIPHEHNVANGVGRNGGETAIDGPTFLSTIGWDWMPAIRDRDTGIWQKAFLSATGPVQIKEPLITTDLPLPKTDSADITVKLKVENTSEVPQKGIVKGEFGNVRFQQAVEIPAQSSQLVTFDPTNTAVLHVLNPKLWWPNGYGPQNLYKLHLSFNQRNKVSDETDIGFGVRKVTYAVSGSPNLTISVNGVPIFVRGGNWGLDEAMKRIPRERLEAQIHLHQLANMNMIRNWVGQSTSEDFYDLCDKYGLLIWDEFFQPNPSDGPDPDDMNTYMANVRDKILRFRNHPAIVVWCARNEGYPPKDIDDALKVMMGELEPTRLYQSNSADGRGVNSHGPYHWRTPREFYTFDEAFKTEIGSISVPTIESIHGMMPEKDWNSFNDDWAQHDFAKGAAQGDLYPGVVSVRYGKIINLADFVRKSQLMNYEAFRAMYEGRNAKLFKPSTGVITWMSNPAQPSFVWQIYHHDLEPNSALYAVRKAGEAVHIQLNEANSDILVINNLPVPLSGDVAHIAIYNLDGTIAYEHDFTVEAAGSAATTIGSVTWPTEVSPVAFVKLDLVDASGKQLSSNFYWHALPANQDDFTLLNTLPAVPLEAKLLRHDAGGRVTLDLTLHNPAKTVALMAHIQMRRKRSGERVLPVFYSDNYLNLAPNETRVISIEASISDLKGEAPALTLDGWNIGLAATRAAISLDPDAQVSGSPQTNMGLN